MGDKRTDPGHYYPGGRVRAKSGTAPQELIVQWSDVQGKPQIAPLPDRYKDGDVKEKVNEIASKFATVVVAALIGWTAVADITVQKKRKDQIYNDEQVVVDVSEDGVGMNTNAVIDIANATIATNPVVAAKLDGPTVAPTNTDEATGKASDAQLTGIALANRYTRAETDAKLAEKRDKIDNVAEWTFFQVPANYFRDLSIVLVSYDEVFGTWTYDLYNGTVKLARAYSSQAETAYFEISTHVLDPDVVRVTAVGNRFALMRDVGMRAYRAAQGSADEIATLNEAGDPMRSGIAKTNVATKVDLDGKLSMESGLAGSSIMWNRDEYGNVFLVLSNAVFSALDFEGEYANFTYDVYVEGDVYAFSGERVDRLTQKADRSMISATNSTFSSEVLKVQIASLSTNITAEVYIAATNACANLGIDPDIIPQGGTLSTVGGLLVALAAAVALLRKKTKLLKSDGTAEDDFATNLLGKPVANAKVRYKLSTASSTTMADRTTNFLQMNGNATLTFPEAIVIDGEKYSRDFLLRVKVTTAGSLTLPADIALAPYSDDFDFTKANDWLIAFTEEGVDANGKAEFYIRAIG